MNLILDQIRIILDFEIVAINALKFHFGDETKINGLDINLIITRMLLSLNAKHLEKNPRTRDFEEV